MTNKPLTDQEVWDEIQGVVDDLYEKYVEMNELDILSLTRQEETTKDMKRNWNVPMEIEVRR